MAQSIIRLPEVKARTGLSRSSIYNGIKAHTFPGTISLSARAVGWLESDISDWIEKRVKAGRASA